MRIVGTKILFRREVWGKLLFKGKYGNKRTGKKFVLFREFKDSDIEEEVGVGYRTTSLEQLVFTFSHM